MGATWYDVDRHFNDCSCQYMITVPLSEINDASISGQIVTVYHRGSMGFRYI